MRLILSCIVLASVTAHASAQSTANWQAAAYSESTGQDGYSFDYKTKSDAETEALRACAQNGVSDCQLVGSGTDCLVLVAAHDKTVKLSIFTTPQAASEMVAKTSSSPDNAPLMVRDICGEKNRKISEQPL